MRARLVTAGWIVLAGCARPAAEPPRSADGSETLSPELVAELDQQRTADEERALISRQLSAPDPSRWRVTQISEPERRLPPIGRRSRVDVHFNDAELEEALRLLADAGGFAMVAEGELAGRVTVELRRVPPYEALVTIAEAHGARVSRHGRIVVVTPAAK